MDKERMAELEKIEAHGAENGWVAPMTEEDREFFAYFRSVFKRYNRCSVEDHVDSSARRPCRTEPKETPPG